jgi:hypothetical protein
MDNTKSNILYDVLSPWAEADAVPLRGIRPRIGDLEKKKIGLFCNSKRAARLILSSIENHLKEKFSELEIKWYEATMPNVPEIESTNKAKFTDWVNSVDAVILAVGD